MLADAENAEAKARADRESAFEAMEVARSIHADAVDATTKQEKYQKDQTEVAEGENATEVKSAHDEYAQSHGMFKTKRDSAIAYLASETVLIGEIRAAIATALNVKQALLQMGHLAMRLGANRAPVNGGGKDDRVVVKGEALHGAAFSTEKGGLYNGEYTASGKLELAGQKTLKERIIAMLDEVDRSLKDELALSQAKAKENTATMKAEHDANVKTSAATLKARLAELQAEVDRTDAIRVTKIAEQKKAQEEEDIARSNMMAADAVHEVRKQEKIDGDIAAEALRAREEAAADHIRETNMQIVDSKRTQGLFYLNQELSTVENIRGMLENLGKKYSFKVPGGNIAREASASAVSAPAVSGFMEVQELEGQQKMTVTQKEAVATLLSILQRHTAGKAKFDHTDNKFETDGAHHADNVQAVHDILDQVVAAINAAKTEVETNHKMDTSTVDDEHAGAYAEAKEKHDAEKARLVAAVVKAKAHLDEMTRIHGEKKAFRKQKDEELRVATKDWNFALDVQRRESAHAESTHKNEMDFFVEHKKNIDGRIADELASDVQYNTEEALAIKEIRKELENINFALLLDLAEGYEEDRKSYMETDSKVFKQKMLDLLNKIDKNLDAEIKRSDVEHGEDTKNNQNEKDTTDATAQSNHKSDKQDLADRVTADRAAFEASDKALDAANAAHAVAADRAQEDKDDFATARKIMDTNAPMLQAEFAKTKQSADHVFAEEMEILSNQKARSDFYLKVNTDGLNSVNKMLSHLDVTSTDTASAPDTGMYGARAAYETTLQDARFSARTAAEHARVAVASDRLAVGSVDVASTGGDSVLKVTNAGQTGVVRADTADHKDSANWGNRDEYDSRGRKTGNTGRAGVAQNVEATNYMKTQTPKMMLLEVAARRAESKTSASSVGTFIGALNSATNAEKRKTGTEFDKEVAAVTATRDSVIGKAKKEMARLKKIDTDRFDAAKEAYAATAEALASALAEKNQASAKHAVDAATLNDSILTKEKMDPVVDQFLKDTLAFNTKTFLTSNKDVDAKFKEGNAYLTKEKEMIQLIREKVNGALANDFPSLIQVMNQAATRHAARLGGRRSHYEFAKRVAKRFEDQQDEAGSDYMTDGTVAANDYSGKQLSIVEMLAENEARITKEIQDVSNRHADDMAFLTKERTDALTVALKRRDSEVAKLQAAVDATVAAYKSAFATRATEQGKRDGLRADLDAKQGALDGAIKEQDASLEEETEVKADADDRTLDHYNTWSHIYDDEEKRANEIIAREQAILAEVRDILAGGLSADAAAAAHVDSCAAEQAANNAAATAYTEAQQKCVEASVKRAGGYANDSEALCAKAEALSKPSEEAERAYQVCAQQQEQGGEQAVAQQQTALVEVGRLAAKYLNEDAAAGFNAATQRDVDAALAVVTELDTKLKDELAAVKSGAAQDRADELAKRDAAYAAANKRYTDAKNLHKGRVAAATTTRNAAKNAWEAQYAVWNKALGAQNKAEVAKRAAQTKYTKDKAVEEGLKRQADQAAEKRYADEKEDVDEIKEADSKYLKEELKAIGQLRDFVKELNARGTKADAQKL